MKQAIIQLKIYVACLAAYNEGVLHGKWIDAAQPYDDVWQEIQDMLKSSPAESAEEWAIHDYEGFGGYKVDEWSDINELCDIANLMQEENGEVILEIMDHLGSGTSIKNAKEYFEENYAGVYEDLEDYAYRYCEDTGVNIPRELAYYIDYKAMGRDFEINGDIFTITLNNELHVFYNR